MGSIKGGVAEFESDCCTANTCVGMCESRKMGISKVAGRDVHPYGVFDTLK